MARDSPTQVAATFDHLFRTKRLVFRAMENSSEHTAFIRDMMLDDPETYAQSTNRLLAPVAWDDVENDIAGLVKSLLAVIICLRPEHDEFTHHHVDEEQEEEGEDRSEEDDEEEDGEEDEQEPEPRPRILPNSRKRKNKKNDHLHQHHHRSGHAPAEDTHLTAIGWLTLDCHALTLHHRSCTLGIMVGSRHQGRGYGTEAIGWALGWAFRVAGMHAVRLSCFSFNDRAARLYQRLGFVCEGVAREAYYFDGQWYNRILFSVLDREWAAGRGLARGGEGS